MLNKIPMQATISWRAIAPAAIGVRFWLRLYKLAYEMAVEKLNQENTQPTKIDSGFSCSIFSEGNDFREHHTKIAEMTPKMKSGT